MKERRKGNKGKKGRKIKKGGRMETKKQDT